MCIDYFLYKPSLHYEIVEERHNSLQPSARHSCCHIYTGCIQTNSLRLKNWQCKQAPESNEILNKSCEYIIIEINTHKPLE
jgi:hypothetical protein